MSVIIEENVELLAADRCHRGWQKRYQHYSNELSCSMKFSLFLPEKREQSPRLLFWLSGLTCSDQDFVFKAAAQHTANELNLAILCPDTSPRGKDVADHENYAIGQAAGFYIDAREEPWAKHYRMESYICRELPQLMQQFNFEPPFALSGHSMGGHGALTLGLRHPELFNSLSAFAPISNPSVAPWGEGLRIYLGDDQSLWQQHDACCLLEQKQAPREFRVDVGLDDEYWDWLNIERLLSGARRHNSPLNLQLHAGYAHGYFFVNSFIQEHLKWHASPLF